MKCKHISRVAIVRLAQVDPNALNLPMLATICEDCDEWLSLGESDETDELVAVEIEAARRAIEWQELNNVPTGYDRFDWCPDGKDERLCDRCETVYLARVICSGDLP